jgi:hypothetical protein
MKKLSLLTISLLIFSCGVQKKAAKDLYAGIYKITVFDVDQIGDVPLTLSINKNDSGYTSNIEAGDEVPYISDLTFEIDSTTIEDGLLVIDGILGDYEIHYELNIDGDDISGSLLGMYDVEGSRVQPQQ